MSLLARFICIGLVLLCSVTAATAQDKAALAQLLKSEKEANELVTHLSSYDARSPWSTEIIWRLAQRLAVQGLTGAQIRRDIINSGEVAAALDADDRTYAVIVWLTGTMVKEKHPGPNLRLLEQVGVPAFDLLGEIMEKPAEQMRELAAEERLRSEPVFMLLTENYARRYRGMSESYF